MGLFCLKLNQNDSSVLKQAGSLLNYQLVIRVKPESMERLYIPPASFNRGQDSIQSINEL